MEAKQVIEQLVKALDDMAELVEMEVYHAREYCDEELQAATKAIKDAKEFLEYGTARLK